MQRTNTEFRNQKRQALELLEWTLADMSPENSPKAQLHFKCGFEREGHFIPEELPEPTEPTKHWQEKQLWKQMNYFAMLM